MTANFIYPAFVAATAANTLICMYISKNKKIPRLLASRYGDNVIVSEQDIQNAQKYEGYTIQTYMYLKYYSNFIYGSCAVATIAFLFL